MMMKGKPMAIGPIRASTIRKNSRETIRISGRINIRNGKRGLDLTPYEARALWNWLGYNAFPQSETEGDVK